MLVGCVIARTLESGQEIPPDDGRPKFDSQGCAVIVLTRGRNFIAIPGSQELRPRAMTLVGIRDALARTYDDVDKNHTLQMAAALSYYFVLSVFPALILLSQWLRICSYPTFSTRQ
jgi:hypothetical protein